MLLHTLYFLLLTTVTVRSITIGLAVEAFNHDKYSAKAIFNRVSKVILQ